MPLENTFRDLTYQLRLLSDNVAAVQMTAREDAPVQGRVMAVDAFSDAVDDANGWIQESLASAVEAQSAIGSPADFEHARLSLIACHERFRRFERSFFFELISYDRLKDLMAFAECRSGEWSAWARSLQQGLDQCSPLMDGTSKALLNCWQELAERVSWPSVSVQNHVGLHVAAGRKNDLVGRK